MLSALQSATCSYSVESDFILYYVLNFVAGSFTFQQGKREERNYKQTK